MLFYDKGLEKDLTIALQLSGQLQDEAVIEPHMTLEKRMDYLAHYANQDHIDNTICILGYDFAPMSFGFAMHHRDKDAHHSLEEIDRLLKDRGKYTTVADVLDVIKYSYWFNGGLIFHGNHDGFGSGKEPTFSVCLTPTSGWPVHT